MRLKFCSRPTY